MRRNRQCRMAEGDDLMAQNDALTRPIRSRREVALDEAVAALEEAESRFADLGRLIAAHGAYDRAHFMERSAARCRTALDRISTLRKEAGE